MFREARQLVWEHTASIDRTICLAVKPGFLDTADTVAPSPSPPHHQGPREGVPGKAAGALQGPAVPEQGQLPSCEGGSASALFKPPYAGRSPPLPTSTCSSSGRGSQLPLGPHPCQPWRQAGHRHNTQEQTAWVYGKQNGVTDLVRTKGQGQCESNISVFSGVSPGPSPCSAPTKICDLSWFTPSINKPQFSPLGNGVNSIIPMPSPCRVAQSAHGCTCAPYLPNIYY